MSLRIDISLGLGYDGAVYDALVQVVRCDPGLLAAQLNAEVIAVTYSQKLAGTASSNRILQLCEHPAEVLIVGVNSSFVIPGYAEPITSAVGGATQPAGASSPITVWLDVTSANGQYYWVKDKDRRKINAPVAVTLFHELSHAYHMAIGDHVPGAPGEVQAITDENAFRGELGLPQRHPSNHDGGVGAPDYNGVGFPACKVQESGTWGLGHCIVATAATESPEAPAVADLRRARDEYRDVGDWGSQIAETVIAQYWRFAPAVVREMDSDPELRRAIRLFAVEPTASLLRAVEATLDSAADAGGIAALEEVLGGYVTAVEAAGVDVEQLQAAADAAELAARQLAAEAREVDGDGRGEHSPERSAPGGVFACLAAEIATSGSDTSGFAWGLEGLAWFLGLAAERRRGVPGLAATDAIAIATWLGRLPLPDNADLELADAPAELGVLRERLFARPESRAAFAELLVDRWRGPALSSVLVDAGYVVDGGESREGRDV